MNDSSESKNIYSKNLKAKSKTPRQGIYYFTELRERPDIVCFRDAASHIIYYLNKKVANKQKQMSSS